MTMPGQQQLDLIDRTLDNLRFIDRYKGEPDVWEVTQIINSFLSVIAHPKDQLFSLSQIRYVLLTDPVVRESGLPTIEISSGYDSEEPRTLGRLLTLLRNGIAHGNIDLLNEAELLARRPDKPRCPGLPRDDIAGIEIWNQDRDRRTWGTVLTILEMRQCLEAIAVLAQRSEYARTRANRKLGGRKEDSPEARELLANRSLSR